MRGDTYTIIFTSTVTIILGLVISLTAESLRSKQEINEELDIKKNILSVLGYSQEGGQWTNDTVQSIYDSSVKEIYINSKGSQVQQTVEQDDKTLKIYQSMNNGLISGYAIPISGKGLWGTMYGYFAIEPDAETVKGITFYKHKETPGLGGEVDKDWFKNNFVGKKLTDNSGDLISIEVIKGYVTNSTPNSDHKVDGISGATVTGKGITNFLKKDLQKYEPYFAKLRKLNQIDSF
jgi:Na+-transporting NADH:ubiquinone oxidoreductase subunit C